MRRVSARLSVVALLALVAWVALGAPACSRTSAPPKAQKKVDFGTEKPTGALAELSGKERALIPELEKDVKELAGKIGERNVEKKWELASAADWLAEELERAGYQVDRTGNEVDGVMAMNIAVEISGSRSDNEIVVVGAHYDSARGSPGADDNASGVAAVLALARRFKGATPDRTLRFVFFANEEPPYFKTANMGSLLYAKTAAGKGEKIVAMLSLECIGYFSDAPNSQEYPKPIAEKYPSTGNFIAVIGNPPSQPLVTRVLEALRARASLPAEGGAFADDVPGVAWSDHWAFWQVQMPAVMITDTAPFRYAHYHKPTDTPDRLDYARMARVVAGVESVVAELVGDVMAPAPNRVTPRPPGF